jgi:hypothetical protein
MKHKHAELIHAWADGAKIQKLVNDEWVDDDPLWGMYTEYRIKPEEKKPVVRWLWAYQVGAGWAMTDFLSTDEVRTSGLVKLEWSRTEFPE